ncbi:MAG TPA: contractile injection system tape measure protein, partial [Candidatus Angelobacter sp.]
MESFRHSIRKQSLKILVDSQETALLLQPRIDEMNRRYLLPAIERALNELDVPGKHVRIASLSVDLGKLPVSELDLSLPERLYLRVCEALKQTLFRAEEGPAPGVSLQSEQASRLELLEHFLVHGTLPFWAPGSAASSLDELLLELEEQTPESLARVLRKCGTQNRVRERMVRQFREPLLQRLLRLLEPENAALILAYIFDLEKTHRAQPVLGLGDTEFARLIWLVVLAYVMQEPGSQFNRKSFVKSLLTGMAEAEGLAYQEMLHILYMGLEQTGRRLPLHSSLPIVIRELARDLGERPGMAPVKHPGAAATNPGDARDDHIEDELDGTPGTAVAGLGPHAASAEDGRQLESLRFFLLHGELPAWATGADGFALQEFLLQLAEDDPDGLVGMIRSCGVQASVRQRLVTQLDRPVLQQLLHLLEPVHAGLIIAYVVDLNEIHRTEPLLPVAGEKFDVILWTLVLAYVLHNPGSQFNRKTFVKTLLENMSLAEGLAYQDVLRILHLGVKRTLKKLTLHSSLPMTIEELASSLKLMPTPGSMVLQHSRSDRQESSTGAESRETGEPGGERFSAHDTSVAPRLELSHYSLTEGLRYYLEHGVLPWGLLVRWPGATAARMMNFLRRMAVAEMETMLRQAAPEKQLAMLLRAARTLPEEHLPFLMQLVLPQAAEQHQLLHEAVERFAASAKDKRTFYSRLITAVLE